MTLVKINDKVLYNFNIIWKMAKAFRGTIKAWITICPGFNSGAYLVKMVHRKAQSIVKVMTMQQVLDSRLANNPNFLGRFRLILEI